MPTVSTDSPTGAFATPATVATRMSLVSQKTRIRLTAQPPSVAPMPNVDKAQTVLTVCAQLASKATLIWNVLMWMSVLEMHAV